MKENKKIIIVLISQISSKLRRSDKFFFYIVKKISICSFHTNIHIRDKEEVGFSSHVLRSTVQEGCYKSQFPLRPQPLPLLHVLQPLPSTTINRCFSYPCIYLAPSFLSLFRTHTHTLFSSTWSRNTLQAFSTVYTCYSAALDEKSVHFRCG